MKMTGLFPGLLAGICALLFAGCAGFDRQWASAPKASARDPFAGQWGGVWKSSKRPGEGGRLSCVLTAVPSDRCSHEREPGLTVINGYVRPPVNPGCYEAAFHAHWKIFTSNYTALFHTEKPGRVLLFSGHHDLPAIFGGTYEFGGRVTPDHFTATYKSSYDSGTFDLHRPK